MNHAHTCTVSKIYNSAFLQLSGSPSNLSSVTNSDQLSLSWSPPPVSADYTNTSTLVFTYNLTLTNNADPVQTISFTTDSNQYNISEVDLPSDYNVCGRYSWSVGISHNGMTVNSVESNDFVHIPSGKVCYCFLYYFL